MNFRWFWLLAIVLISGLSNVTDAQQSPQRPQFPDQQRSCNVPFRRRRECGWAGISKETCLSKGCCFDNSVRGVKWCFQPE